MNVFVSDGLYQFNNSISLSIILDCIQILNVYNIQKEPHIFERIYKPELKPLDALTASEKPIVLMERGSLGEDCLKQSAYLYFS